MVLLYLTKFVLGVELPVICFKEPWFPHKLEFTNEIIRKWNLTVWDWAPSRVSLCSGNGRIDVIHRYQIGPKPDGFLGEAVLARGTEIPEENLPWLCGVDTFLSRPTGSFHPHWNLLIHGHKSSDDDPCSGKIPLETDFLLDPPNPASVFPLRNWTDDDIFEFTKERGIPFDRSRYDLDEKKVLPNKWMSPDYYHTCFACCDPSMPKFVHCPKRNAQVNNISHLVPWEFPSGEYCNLRTQPN